MECFLGLDIGTTSTIGILISLPNKVLAQTSRPVSFISLKTGWAEEDPDQWWANVCDIVPELIQSAAISASDIKGIGVTGMLPALVILDEADQLLRNAIQQSDARSSHEVVEISKEIDENTFIETAGNGINQQLIATKLRWLKKNEPDVFAKINTVFGSYDFINWKLTNVKAIELNWALEAGFIDINENKLSAELIKLAHIDFDKLPKTVKSHEVVGYVSSDAAMATGLSIGTPVVGGAADHIASGLAAGIIQPGDVLLKFGGSTDIVTAAKAALPDSRLFLDYHLIPEMFMPNGCMASGGSALNWFIDKMVDEKAEKAKEVGLSMHQYLDYISKDIPAGCDGLQIIPYFLGEKTPIHNSDARAIIHGLSLNHDFRYFWRALLEGFAYAYRHHIDVLEDIGYPTYRFFASDGGSNSKLWMQICADVIKNPIQLLNGHPGSCLGAAWTAAIGTGYSEEWHGISRFISYGEKIYPNDANTKLFDQGYLMFRQTYLNHYKVSHHHE